MELLTAEEASKQLRIRPSVFRKIVSGKVKGVPIPPSVKLGRTQFFRKDSLEQWVIEQETRPEAVRQVA